MSQRTAPGSVRVGLFIARLGVVSLPAVGAGLGLADRVVRRHVARLEALGWMRRAAALRGDGSLVWLTPEGLEGVERGELPAVRDPEPFSAHTMHSVRVAWSAARLERLGYRWLAAREMSLDRERWSIEVRNERAGHSRRLPDLAVCLPDGSLPAAVVVEHRMERAQRRRAVLEGWQAALSAERYARVQYDCSDPMLARELTRIAADVGLSASQFRALDPSRGE